MKNVAWTTLLLFTLAINCTKKADDETNIVAKVDQEKISFEELNQSFKLNPKYAIKTPLRIARESQLNFLVNNKYSFLASREAELDQDVLIQKRISYIKNQETIKAYLNKAIFRNIEITDEELLEAFAKFDKKIRVRHLSASSLVAAKELKNRLDNGEKFSSLAKEIYRSSELVETGGDLGFITFGDLDPTLEDPVYEMSLGEVCDPLSSSVGYHIFQILEIQQNEKSQDLNPVAKMEYVKQILMDRKIDRKIRDHLKLLAGNQKIQVNNRLVDLLLGATKKVMGFRYEDMNVFKPPVLQGDLNSIRLDVSQFGDELIGKFGNREMTVDEFLERLKQMPPLHRPYMGTRSRMIQSIIDIIRDDILLEKAIAEGFDKDEPARQNASHFIKELLASEFRRRIGSDEFKMANPERWQEYMDIYENIRETYPPQINTKILFSDVTNPDSVMAPTPIRLVLRNNYVW